MSEREISIALIIPTAIVVVLHVLLLNTGHLVVYSTEFAGRSRSTLGFTNANQASSIYLSLVIIPIFTHIQWRNKVSLLIMVASYFAAFYVVMLTDTRTVMFALILLIVFQTQGRLFHRNNDYKFIVRIIGAAVPFLSCVATYYLTTSRNPELNAILSAKPYVFSQFIRTVTPYDFIFGWQPTGAAGVDNLYLMLLAGVGGIAFLVILLGWSYLIFRMNPTFIPLVFVLLTISVFESFLLRPEIPVSVLFPHLLLSGVLQRYKERYR